ncbi:MAG: hypothetical protein ABL973_13025 [Micropepsaceae bacterium]
MKYPALMAGAIVAAAAFFVGTVEPVAHASNSVCLRIRDLGNLKPIDDSTVMATSRNQGNFIVKLRGPCRDFQQIDNYYVVRVMSNQECFDGDDVLQFRYGGLCFVQSVTPAH